MTYKKNIAVFVVGAALLSGTHLMFAYDQKETFSFVNSGTFASGKTTNLSSGTSLKNTGTISGGEAVVLKAGESIISEGEKSCIKAPRVELSATKRCEVTNLTCDELKLDVGSKAVLSNATIASIKVTNKTTLALIACVVSGDIIFENGGQVVLEKDSKVQGKIVGATS